MMRKKSILVFFPHNFYEMSAGCHRRIYDLLVYFRTRGFRTDLLSLSGFTNEWGKGDLERRDLADSIRVCKWRPSIRDKAEMGWRLITGRLQDFAITSLRRAFAEMSRERDYDYYLISYAYWTGLLDGVNTKAKKIIDLHDFLTLNLFLKKGTDKFNLGRMFEDEVRSINRFDCAVSISAEETVALSPFCRTTKFIDVPVFFPPNFYHNNAKNHAYDLLFIGSDNPFNQKGMEWFMKEAYPLLPHDLKMVIVGKICTFIEKRRNITLVPHADDVGPYYIDSKIVINPLQGGSGLKVKVIEALSFAIPVVTTRWGLTGILEKKCNGCISANTPDEFAEAIRSLLQDNDRYNRLRREAEDFFLNNYSVEHVYKKIDNLFLS